MNRKHLPTHLLLLLVLNFFGFYHPVQAAPPQLFTLADLGESDAIFRNIYDQFSVHFPLAEGRSIDHAVLHLHLSHGASLLPETSDVTISLNEEPVANLPLTPDNANKNFVDIDLPVDALHPGDNLLTFIVNQRLRKQGCGDFDKPGLWTKIWMDTSIGLEGHDLPIKPDLGKYPAPFTSLSTLEGNPGILVVLPRQPTAAELTAAAQIAATLGQVAQWEFPPLHAVTIDQLDKTQAGADHLIAIGIDGRNQLSEGAPIGVSEHPSPLNPNRLLLVVSGADDASLLESATLLSTHSARSMLMGTSTPPHSITPQPFIVRPSEAKFSDLGFETRRVRGIGLHDLYYPIDVPYNWKITSDASIEVHFTHSNRLTAKTAQMTVFVNGFELADVPLTNRNDSDGRLTVRLSPRQLHPGRNWLHLAFDLHIEDEDCSFRYLEEAWAEISNTSTIYTAHVESEPPLDLHYLPSPLVTPPDLSDDIFILPSQPNTSELSALVQLSAKLGTYSSADSLRPRAITDNQFSPSTMLDKRVIAIGTLESNAFLATYNEKLPQPLNRIGGVIVPSVGRELLPEETAGQAGYIQLLQAPWSRRSALVVISAPGELQLEQAVHAIPTMGKRLKVQGNVAVITAEKTTGLAIGELGIAPLSMHVRLTLIGIFIGAFTIIGVGGLIFALRKQAREQEKKNAEN